MTAQPDARAVIERLRRLHGLMLANAGGDFEVDCDEDFRLTCKATLPALLDVAEAAARSVIARVCDDHCPAILLGGGEDLRAALAKLAEVGRG